MYFKILKFINLEDLYKLLVKILITKKINLKIFIYYKFVFLKNLISFNFKIRMFYQDLLNPVSDEEWSGISKNNILSEDFIRKYSDKVNWFYISSSQKLSCQFIEEFQDKVDWNNISRYQKLNIDFLNQFKNKVNWNLITIYQLDNFEFINKFSKYLNWNQIEEFNFLSEDFIREFKYNLDWQKIKLYLKRSTKQKYYSVDFIKEFKPYFNEFYIYNYFANKIINQCLKYIYKPGNIGYLRLLKEIDTSFLF